MTFRFTDKGPAAVDLNPDIFKEKLEFLDVFGRIALEQQIIPTELKDKYGGKIPYDVYFPSQQQKVENRVCQVCGMYFSSVKSLVQQHRKVCKKPRKGGAAVKNKHSVNRKATLLDDSDEDNDMSEDAEENCDESIEYEAIDELNASFEDDQNNKDFENMEEVYLEPIISVQSEGGFQIILDLKQWLKSPWNTVKD